MKEEEARLVVDKLLDDVSNDPETIRMRLVEWIGLQQSINRSFKNLLNLQNQKLDALNEIIKELCRELGLEESDEDE